MSPLKKYLAATLVAAFFASASVAQEVITMATGAQGSLAYNSGQAVAKVANEKGMIVRTQPIEGYLPLINSGEVDFGFSNAVEAEFSYSGTGNYDRASPNLRLVGVMFPLKTGIMVPADTGITTVQDLKAHTGKLRIASEYTASTIIPYYIAGALANGGMTYDDFKKVPVSSFVGGIQALGDGLVDIALVSLNAGAGKQADVKLKSRGGLQYVSLDNSPEGVAAFKKFLPAGEIISLPQNDNIAGLQTPANLISIPWMLLTHVDADEAMIYAMTQTIAENNAALGESFALFKQAKKEAMAPANAVPYHPGALRYFKDAGITVGAQ